MTRKLLLIVLAASLVVTGAWYMLLWKPSGTQLASARQALAAAKSANLTASLQQDALVKRRSLLPAEEQKAAALDAAVPEKPGIDTMIDQISAIAAASGVTWQSESQSQASTSPAAAAATPAAPGSSALASLSLTMSVSGTYDQLLDFVGRLQTVPRLIKISTLSLGGGGSAGSGSSTGSGSGAATPGSGSGITSSGGPAILTTQISATMYEATTPLPAPPASH